MRHIHAVADHEHVGADEADEIGLDGDRALAGLLEQNGGQNPPRAARGQKVLGEDQGRPDSRMSSMSRMSRSRTLLSTSRRISTWPDDTVAAR
jgi:hypothetical protein